MNTAWLVEHVEKVHPGLSEVILVVFTVEQFTFSLQLIVTLLFNATLAAPFVGMVELTAGAVVSTVTVLGVGNTADTFPAASFTQGYKVYVPSDATVYVAGAVPVHPASPARGGVADSVIL